MARLNCLLLQYWFIALIHFPLVYIYRYITGSLELEHFLTLTWEKKKPLDGANGQKIRKLQVYLP